MSAKREALIDTAIRLFAKNGFHATGIDRIAEEAGVTKKTLYHHFRSKEELIVAALKKHDDLFRDYFVKSVERLSGTPVDRLVGIFDVAHAWFSKRDFYGCLFVNAIAEYSHGNTAIRRACQDFKSQMARHVEELARAAGARDPAELAQALALVLEGSIVTAQVAGCPDSARTARSIARVLIDEALTIPA